MVDPEVLDGVDTDREQSSSGTASRASEASTLGDGESALSSGLATLLSGGLGGVSSAIFRP